MPDEGVDKNHFDLDSRKNQVVPRTGVCLVYRLRLDASAQGHIVVILDYLHLQPSQRLSELSEGQAMFSPKCYKSL